MQKCECVPNERVVIEWCVLQTQHTQKRKQYAIRAIEIEVKQPAATSTVLNNLFERLMTSLRRASVSKMPTNAWFWRGNRLRRCDGGDDKVAEGGGRRRRPIWIQPLTHMHTAYAPSNSVSILLVFFFLTELRTRVQQKNSHTHNMYDKWAYSKLDDIRTYRHGSKKSFFNTI